MTENQIENKSFDFAVRIVNLYKHLNSEKKEYVLSKQLLVPAQASVLMFPKHNAGKAKLILYQK